MRNLFEFAAGSVAGRDHRIAGRNNQDAFALLCTEDFTVAILCDGCGSGRHSEVGAKIGAPLLAQTFARYIRRWQAAALPEPMRALPFPFWEQVRQDVLARLRVLAQEMGDSLSAVIGDYFLFTVVGALLTPQGCAFFSAGDGVISINGETISLGPFPHNAPPYLAYALVEMELVTVTPERLRFHVHRLLPAGEVRHFLLGTDGVNDLRRLEERPLPGKTEPVGPIGQFWQEDRYFRNPDMIRRRLEGINREVVMLDRTDISLRREGGLLSDDTTILVGRRLSAGDNDANQPASLH